jgi:oxygen-independent coproporphyrinogen-3 oxidase
MRLARAADFDNVNLDLMYALPSQDLGQARADLEQALALEPEHLSYYQLTLEPNTPFFLAPPPVPNEDESADMHLQGIELLAAHGFRRYEVSAYARPGQRCTHNLNYWTFGDYLGIGAGAHGKRSDIRSGTVERSVRLQHPAAYLSAEQRHRLVSDRRRLHPRDLVLEFAMNALRLTDGFDRQMFERNTGLEFTFIRGQIEKAKQRGLLEQDGPRMRPSELGARFLNDLLCGFSTDEGEYAVA